MIYRGFRYRLYPTDEQEELFRQFAGVCRFIYNLALEQRRDWWRQFQRTEGLPISFASQCRELTDLRAQFDWIAAVCNTCQAQALRDLDRVFRRFYRGQGGYPKPQKKGDRDTFRFKSVEVGVRQLNAKWSIARLPKIGWVKFRNSRPLTGKIKNVTVSASASGWHISFACEIEQNERDSILPTVGIDRGVANTITLSTGEHFSVPNSVHKLDRKCRIAQRRLSRKKRGSGRRDKALRRCRQISARRVRIRTDWAHRTALNIANRFGAAILEDLNIRNMVATAAGTIEEPGSNVRAKAALNHSILTQGWYAFERLLAYKLEERGGTLIKVNPAYTSQTCSCCGTVDSRSRESQASFVCVACGFRAHADHNAAINILRRNTASMRMEEGHQLSDEVRTGQGHMILENPLATAGGGC